MTKTYLWSRCLSTVPLFCLCAAISPISCGGDSGGEMMTTAEEAGEAGSEGSSGEGEDSESGPNTGSEQSSATGESMTGEATETGESGTSGDSGSEESTGDSTEESTGDSTEDSTGDSTGDEASFVVSGVVTRSVDPADGNDAEGRLIMSLLLSCDAGAQPVVGSFLEGASLAADGAEQPFSIPGVPNGKYFLTGYLDDNENSDQNAPIPDKGDFVAVAGMGVSCVEVNIDGADVSGLKLDLNFVLPF